MINSPHLRTTVVCAVLTQAVYLLSFRLFQNNKHFKILDQRRKNDWAMRVTSTVHAISILIACLPIMINSQPQDPIYGYIYYDSQVYAAAAGYFLWDSIVSIQTFKEHGLGFVLHGIVAFMAFFGSQVFGIFNYYGSLFLMFELSLINLI
jgi:hypothetical protein